LIESEKLIIFFAVIDDPAVTSGELFWSKKNTISVKQGSKTRNLAKPAMAE